MPAVFPPRYYWFLYRDAARHRHCYAGADGRGNRFAVTPVYHKLAMPLCS